MGQHSATGNEEVAAHDGADDAIDRVEQEWRRERPDIDVSPMGIISRIWRVGRHLEQYRKEHLEEFGSDRGTIDILGMLRRSGPPYRCTAGELTQSALITAGGVSQRLSKLEQAGLLTRHVRATDRRLVDVELTTAGADLVDSILTGLMSAEAQVLADALTADEQEQLRQLLRTLLRRLEPVGDIG